MHTIPSTGREIDKLQNESEVLEKLLFPKKIQWESLFIEKKVLSP
jgi:hypothetical protein